MTTNMNLRATRTYFENHLDLERCFAYVSPQVIWHGFAGMPMTYDAWKGAQAMFIAALPDMTITIDSEAAEGDRVATRWTCRGTHRGSLMGIPPTGKHLTFSGISIDSIDNGNIIEHWVQHDQMTLMQQLGML